MHVSIGGNYTLSIKPQSHIACNLLATYLLPLFRVVVGRLQRCRKAVANWSPTGCRCCRKVARTIWLQWGFACCKWNFPSTKSIVDEFLVIARRSGTGRRLFADWSPNSRRPFCDHKHTLKKQSPTSRLPIADLSPVDRRPVGNRSVLTWHDINQHVALSLNTLIA